MQIFWDPWKALQLSLRISLSLQRLQIILKWPGSGDAYTKLLTEGFGICSVVPKMLNALLTAIIKNMQELMHGTSSAGIAWCLCVTSAMILLAELHYMLHPWR
jgi:hypothetical protein